MDQYCYKGQHEAIIPREKFEMVQALLQNRKHHIRGAFPCLHVIDGGVFRGFVPINHHWINEDPRLYYDSSNSVDQKAGKMRFAKSSFSAFDLKGYQVVRNQFTQARYEGPAVTISNNRITFNLFCMRKFADAGYAQLLLHPSERKLAIRPCQESAMHSIPWRSGAAKSLYAKTLCCRHFGAALFRIMEWDPDFLYRVRGTWIQRGEEQIIIYNLEHAVSAVLLPQMREAPGRETRAECFPEPWEDSFGEEFYDHIMGNEAFYMARGTAWQAGRPSVLAPGIGQYVPQTGGEFQKMMETLRRKAASGDGG